MRRSLRPPAPPPLAAPPGPGRAARHRRRLCLQLFRRLRGRCGAGGGSQRRPAARHRHARLRSVGLRHDAAAPAAPRSTPPRRRRGARTAAGRGPPPGRPGPAGQSAARPSRPARPCSPRRRARRPRPSPRRCSGRSCATCASRSRAIPIPSARGPSNVDLSQRRAQSLADFLASKRRRTRPAGGARLRPRPAAARHPRQRRREPARRGGPDQLTASAGELGRDQIGELHRLRRIEARVAMGVVAVGHSARSAARRRRVHSATSRPVISKWRPPQVTPSAAAMAKKARVSARIMVSGRVL